MRLNTLLSPFICSRIVCSLLSANKKFKKNKLVVSNHCQEPCVKDDLPGITIQRCILSPDHNGAYTEKGELLGCSALLRGSRKKRFASPDQISINRNHRVIPACIYGGILFGNHYGHFLTETMSRLWPLIDPEFVRQWADTPIVFRMAGDKQYALDEVAEFAKNVFDALGIRHKIIVLDHQTMVDTLVIPHASIVNNYKVHKVYTELMQLVGSRLLELEGNARAWSDEKIYLSRSNLSAECRHLGNERRLELMLIERGYTVVHPQEISFIDQVKMFHQASEVIGPVGSAFHTLPLAGRSNILIKYLVDDTYSRMKGTTYNNIDAALGIDSQFVHCLYPHRLSFKPASFQDKIIDLDRALQGVAGIN